jgi:uncharacterized protein
MFSSSGLAFKEMQLRTEGAAMKITMFITQWCNLDCQYCYVAKKKKFIHLEMAQKIIDFAYCAAPPGEMMDIGFFGGEPLLAFDEIRSITKMIEQHPSFEDHPSTLSLVSNGTIFNSTIRDFLIDHDIVFGISCDGPALIQNRYRSFRNGEGTSRTVEATIKRALPDFPLLMVNAVLTPATICHLPVTIDYFISLGLKRIYLNLDYAASWSDKHIEMLPRVYGEVAQRYIAHQRSGNPVFISLIDSKIMTLLRGGYQPQERCRMGRGELAFDTNGNIYPCERLAGFDDVDAHCIGHVDRGIFPETISCHTSSGCKTNNECQSCAISDYCMHWCGCSNYFSTGFYNRVSSFLCFSERCAIETAFDVFKTLKSETGVDFYHHMTRATAQIPPEIATRQRMNAQHDQPPKQKGDRHECQPSD